MNQKLPKVCIKIQYEDFDVSKETQKLHHNLTGAIVNFVGLVRGHNENDSEQVSSMTLEHYPGMTELEIKKIVKQSYERWDITGATVIHRIGKLLPTDQIVFVGVSSRHRQNAFDSCNFIMDWLKTKAPFWKVEENEHQKKWVDYNLSDDEATKKWII